MALKWLSGNNENQDALLKCIQEMEERLNHSISLLSEKIDELKESQECLRKEIDTILGTRKELSVHSEGKPQIISPNEYITDRDVTSCSSELTQTGGTKSSMRVADNEADISSSYSYELTKFVDDYNANINLRNITHLVPTYEAIKEFEYLASNEERLRTVTRLRKEPYDLILLEEKSRNGLFIARGIESSPSSRTMYFLAPRMGVKLSKQVYYDKIYAVFFDAQDLELDGGRVKLLKPAIIEKTGGEFYFVEQGLIELT